MESLTCFASNQPICPGARCYVSLVRQQSGYNPVSLLFQGLPLTQESIGRSTYEPNAFWEPMCGFLEAQSDGIRILALSRTRRNFYQMVYLVEAVLSTAAITEKGTNSMHETPYDLPAFMAANTPELTAWLRQADRMSLLPTVFDALFEELDAIFDYTMWAVIRKRLFIGDGNRLRPAELAVMHHIAYEDLTHVDAKEDESVECHVRGIFDRMLRGVQRVSGGKFVSKCRSMLHTLSPTLRSDYLDSALAVFMRGALSNFDVFAHGLTAMEREVVKAELGQYLAHKRPDDALFEDIKPFLMDRQVMLGLHHLNIRITPMVFAAAWRDAHVGLPYALFVQRVGRHIEETVAQLEE